MHPLTVIEVAIGLFDKDTPPAKTPPVMARWILDALHYNGWIVERCNHPETLAIAAVRDVCVVCGHTWLTEGDVT